MQIHEITEGLLSSFASGITGLDIPQSQAGAARQAAQSAEKLRAQGYNAYTTTGNIERIVVSVMQPDQTTPSKYIKTGTTWTNEAGAVITNPKSKAYLDSLIPTHGKKEIIPVNNVTTQPSRKVSRQRVPRGRTVKTK